MDMPGLGIAGVLVASEPLGGPAGIAAIVWRKDLALTPLWHGGGQNLGRRSGTEAVALAAGLGEAAKHAAGGPGKVGPEPPLPESERAIEPNPRRTDREPAPQLIGVGKRRIGLWRRADGQ